MDTGLLYEIIGYIASVLVAVSLMMTKIVRLRVVNMIGAATFTLYGILIGSIPVAAVNAFIVLVNIWYLARIYRAEEFFKLMRVEPEAEYLRLFVDHYADEIDKYQPGFSNDDVESDLCLFVLRDLVPAGLLLGDLDDKGNLLVKLDFVIPSYRDFKVGRFLFGDRVEYFHGLGVKEILARPGNREHSRYLERMGFQPARGSESLYRYTLV